MSFSSKAWHFAVALFLWGAMLLVGAGCMADRPSETDMPWASPASWEGTIGLPSSFTHQYD